MDILITGSTGLIGSILSDTLRAKGHRVTALTRNTDNNTLPFWNIEQNTIDLKGLEPELVIHLAGENIAAASCSASQKARFLYSRYHGTELLIS